MLALRQNWKLDLMSSFALNMFNPFWVLVVVVFRDQSLEFHFHGMLFSNYFNLCSRCFKIGSWTIRFSWCETEPIVLRLWCSLIEICRPVRYPLGHTSSS